MQQCLEIKQNKNRRNQHKYIVTTGQYYHETEFYTRIKKKNPNVIQQQQQQHTQIAKRTPRMCISEQQMQQLEKCACVSENQPTALTLLVGFTLSLSQNNRNERAAHQYREEEKTNLS